MLKHYPFSAVLTYTFGATPITLCVNCGKRFEDHAKKACLFESTEFAVHPLKTFLEQLLREGGILTLTSGTTVLTQTVCAAGVDQHPARFHADIRTMGEACLEVECHE